MAEEIIRKVIENLEKNNIKGYYCKSKKDALSLVEELIPKGATVSNGGSQTLKETKIMDLLKSGKYNFLDRSVPGMTREDVEKVYREAYTADCYLASCNAVTEDGYLYNVDGNSNRVSAILYGPKSVILICGKNKIVKNISQAVKRVKTIAAPKNTLRLNCDTFCAKEGKCVSLNSDSSEICDGCHSESRVCCNFVLSGYQRNKNRIKVIIIDEELGY